MNQNRVPLLRLAPEIWKYQAFTKLPLVPLFAASRKALAPSAFDTWRGIAFSALLLILSALYIAVDLNVKVLYAGNVVDGVNESFFVTLKKALAAVPKFIRVHGVGVMLYMALIPPAIAAGWLVFHWETPGAPLWRLLYAVLALGFASLGVTRIFYLHGVLLDGLSIWEARRQSKTLMSLYRRIFFGQHVAYALSGLAFVTLGGIVFFIAPLSFGARILPQIYDATTARSVMILLLFINASLSGALGLLAAPCYFIRLTMLYRREAAGEPVAIPDRAVERHPALAAMAFFYVLEIAALSSQTAYNIDAFFPPLTETLIIAHRGGGNENAENTLSGLETAIALGATGSEIDIQRTADGRYIVNHDETFERVAGDPRAPKNMTLEEVKQLRYPVPTLEEMLDASRGRIWLFIELKGSTADKRMCNDTVRLIRARNMAEQTVIMSFNHNLIAYVEGRWPEIRTACLTLEREDAASLVCDYIGVEAHAVTAPYIRAVHEQGKKLLVWTPNGAEAQEYFLIGDADAVITDNVEQAFQIRDCLNRKNDLGRILSAFRQ